MKKLGIEGEKGPHLLLNQGLRSVLKISSRNSRKSTGFGDGEQDENLNSSTYQLCGPGKVA